MKRHFVGLRITDEEGRVLSRAQDKFNLTKTEVLLMGLDLMAEYYSLGLDKHPLSIELKELESQARQYGERLKRVRDRAAALREMVGELRAVDDIVDRYGRKESSLIQILLAVQEQNHWLPRAALIWISETLKVPIARTYQIASFYEALSLEPRGRHLIQVCTGTACYVRGAPKVLDRIEEVLKLRPGETDPEQFFTMKTVHCLGCCALAPVVKVDNEYYGDPSVTQLQEVVAALREVEKK